MSLSRVSARGLAAIAFLGGIACGAPFVLVAHERDVARWRASAASTSSRIGAHLEHTLQDIARDEVLRVAEQPTTIGRIPRLVNGVQIVADGKILAQAHRSGDVPKFISCGEHAAAGAPLSVVPYQRFPSLLLVGCVSIPSAGAIERWMVVWLDNEKLFQAAGIRDLVDQGFDYRLLDVSRVTQTPLESSRPRAWRGAVRQEIALPAGKWILELQTRDAARVNASLLTGSVIVFAASSLLGLFAYGLGTEPERLRGELATSREHARGLDARLTDEFERRRSAEEKLEHGARYDDLTRLPNRSFFIERLNNALALSGRRSTSASLLLFDVERLRLVNDSMGRVVGDQVLRGVARRIEAANRPEDILARVDADQFGVLQFNALEVEPTVRFVEGVVETIEQPFALAGTDVFVTCRVGIVMLDGYQRAEDALRDATIALERAGANDGSMLQVFGQEMHARAVRLQEIETDLRRAVERDEMVAYYQPILSLTTGRIIGFETLARWQHPERGIVSPADFIPIAEQTGLIIQIDRWNLAEGARQLALWQKAFPRETPLKLSANLAANELSRPDIVDFVAGVLEETELDPRTLAIEVTESGVMKNPESAAKILTGLEALGVHLHLDDFGTGYSSLAYLHRFSFHLLKIDRAFVGRMTTDPKSHELVKTVMALARALDMGVVAEGIETEEQLAELRSMRCEMAQGFLFSRPVPPDEIETLLAQDPVW